MKSEVAIATNLCRGHDLPTTLRSLQQFGVEYADLDFFRILPSLFKGGDIRYINFYKIEENNLKND